MTHSPLLKPKTDLTELHGAEQRKEFVALDLPDAQVVQAIAREGRGMICYLHQPRQHGSGIGLEYVGHGADAQPFGERPGEQPDEKHRQAGGGLYQGNHAR